MFKYIYSLFTIVNMLINGCFIQLTNKGQTLAYNLHNIQIDIDIKFWEGNNLNL